MLGYDSALTLLDFNHEPRIVSNRPLAGTVGSVKWSRLTDSKLHVRLYAGLRM
jgi:hypothetical protein